MKLIFNSWNYSYRELQNDEDTLGMMDGYNQTKHEKKKTPLVEAAREAFEKEWVYFASAFEGSKPMAFLEMNRGFFNITFLDEQLRKYRMMTWNRGPSGQIFLREAQSWEYDGESDEMTSTIIRTYDPEGTVTTEFTIFPSYDTISQEFPCDVSHHWVDFPKFGEYEGIMRMDLVDWELKPDNCEQLK